MPRPDGETPDVSIAYCPERVLPGKILEELTNNDRSIGGITPRCARKALAFYKRFVRGTCITTDARSAEMTKLVENAYRDVNIAFANELSIVADRMGLDVWEVIRLANRHPRVNILQPGPGVGGHCIAVDPWFIVHGAPEETPLIRTARGVNDGKIHHVIARAERTAGRASGRQSRLPRPRLQGQHRRFPRKPGAPRRRHAGPQVWRADQGGRTLCRRAAARIHRHRGRTDRHRHRAGGLRTS
jgi:nucleotide sugar dehydrogenase